VIEVVCRNFFWGAKETFARIPLAKWTVVCTLKKERGLGFKNLVAWNKSLIAKHIWDVAIKKDNLWVKWIHKQYLRMSNWWDYQL